MIKFLAVFIAAILALSLTTAAYAQNATSLQIQIVPQIQRGQQQHLTVFAVDDNGNIVNGTGEIISSIENAKGVLVGPKTVYTESGEDVRYKVGPNTSPQNISINSCLSDSEICALQTYYVYPKGKAQVPPNATEPEYPPAVPVPTPEPPITNDSMTGEIVIPSNETEVTTPENGTDVTINDTGEAEPLPPIANETTGNETAEVPPIINETQGNATIPTPPTINETAPSECIPLTNATGNAAVDINQAVNQAGCPEATPTPLPINETAGGNETIPVPIPINETQANETLPIPELPTNATQNATVEPEPLPPTNGGGQRLTALLQPKASS